METGDAWPDLARLASRLAALPFNANSKDLNMVSRSGEHISIFYDLSELNVSMSSMDHFDLWFAVDPGVTPG